MLWGFYTILSFLRKCCTICNVRFSQKRWCKQTRWNHSWRKKSFYLFNLNKKSLVVLRLKFKNCETCGYRANSFNMRIHFKLKHNLTYQVQELWRNSKLFRMWTKVCNRHDGKNPFSCPICEGSYSDNFNLQRHIRLVHEGERKYKCSIC